MGLVEAGAATIRVWVARVGRNCTVGLTAQHVVRLTDERAVSVVSVELRATPIDSEQVHRAKPFLQSELARVVDGSCQALAHDDRTLGRVETLAVANRWRETIV